MTAAAQQTYLANRVKTATPSGLIVLLYEGLIRFALDARDGFAEGTPDSNIHAMNCITRCTNILNELNMSLNYQIAPELCARLSGLYTFFTMELSRSIKEKNPEIIDKLIPMIEELLEGWRQVEHQSQNST